MTDIAFVMTGAQRDEIRKAIQAIERQLKELSEKPHWQALWVIDTNLTIIRTNVANVPRVSAN